MLDIIVLIFLCRSIGITALKKGLRPGQWKLYTVLSWIACEFLGLIIGILLFGFNKNDMFGLLLFTFACGFGGYLIIRAVLDKKPDIIDEDSINNIGM